MNTVKITGKFGWGSTSTTGVPATIRDAAVTMTIRAFRARDIGYQNAVGVERCR